MAAAILLAAQVLIMESLMAHPTSDVQNGQPFVFKATKRRAHYLAHSRDDRGLDLKSSKIN